MSSRAQAGILRAGKKRESPMQKSRAAKPGKGRTYWKRIARLSDAPIERMAEEFGDRLCAPLRMGFQGNT
jgi:hypothetical protein